MKVTLKLTMDGLMRALRGRMHRLAEEIEAGRRLPDEARRRGRLAARRTSRLNERKGDDSSD